MKVFANGHSHKKCLADLARSGCQVIPVSETGQDTDEAMVQEAESDLEHLPENGALVPGDSEFAEMVKRIAQSGRNPMILANDYNLSRKLWQTACGQFFKLVRLSDPNIGVQMHLVTTWEEHGCAKAKLVGSHKQNLPQLQRVKVRKTYSTYNQQGPGVTMVIRSVPNRFCSESRSGSDGLVLVEPSAT